jgi:hypothetical protein
MSDSGLLQAILINLDRAGTPDNKWPDNQGEYWALCPFHTDQHAHGLLRRLSSSIIWTPVFFYIGHFLRLLMVLKWR